jgi:hypothetical protein
MEPWEAVEQRTGINEFEFRSENEESRSLLAFWLESDDIGPYCVAGIDWEYAGGIDDVIDLVRRIITVAALGGRFDRPPVLHEAFRQVIDLTAELVADVREDCDLQENEKPSTEQIDEMVEGKWLYQALGPFLQALFKEVGSVDIEPVEEFNMHSHWRNTYVWAEDELKAKAELRSVICRIRSVVDAAQVDT